MEIKWSRFVRRISYREFKKYINSLSKQIDSYCKENNIRVDYIVPILRSGAVPAVYIANNLNIIKFAPIQTKWITNNGSRETKILLNSLKMLDKNKSYNLLLVEGTFSSGETIRVTINEVKKTLPKANIMLSCIVARSPENLPNDICKNFYALGLSGRRLGELFVYPWEVKKEKEEHGDRNIENIFF